jgi:steroid 5-alpha reductase family enzyme
MSSISSILLTSFLVSGAGFFLVWIISVFKRDASIIDIFWSIGCVLPGIVAYYLVGENFPYQILLLTLGLIWAVRLAGYLAIRNLPHGEDYRYARARKSVGDDRKFALVSLVRIYGVQFILSWLISLPLQLGMVGVGSTPIGVLGYLGAAVWLVGLVFEAGGDYQLTQFKKDPANKGKLMMQGLWSWTRHPNYFGDSMIWSGLSMIALASPYGIWAIISPVMMTFFLLKVTGKSLTELHMMKKYPEYEAYKRQTSGFIPMPPKS